MCPIKEMAKNRGNYLQVYFQSKQNIEQVTMDFRVVVPTALNKESDILKFRTDACKLTTFQGKNPLVTSVLKSLLKDSSFPKNCPIRAVNNIRFYIQNFVFIFFFNSRTTHMAWNISLWILTSFLVIHPKWILQQLLTYLRRNDV